MTMCDFVWLCMTMYDYVWAFMTIYNYFWVCMTKYEREKENNLKNFFLLFSYLFETIIIFQTIQTFSHDSNLFILFNKPWLCLPLFDIQKIQLTSLTATNNPAWASQPHHKIPLPNPPKISLGNPKLPLLYPLARSCPFPITFTAS